MWLVQSLKDLEDKITEDQKTELTESIENLKKSHQDKDLEGIKIKLDELNSKFQKVSENLYSQSQTEPQTDSTDVEFEEVN